MTLTHLRSDNSPAQVGARDPLPITTARPPTADALYAASGNGAPQNLPANAVLVELSASGGDLWYRFGDASVAAAAVPSSTVTTGAPRFLGKGLTVAVDVRDSTKYAVVTPNGYALAWWTGVKATTTTAPTPPPVVTAPSAPANFVATPGTEQVALSWATPPAGLTAQTLTYSPGNGTVNVNATQSTATVPSLTAGTAYVFTLTQTNSGGTSPASIASATPTAAQSAPAAPTNFTAARAPGTATLSWDAPPSGVTAQTLRRDGTAIPIAANATGYTDTGRTNGTEYAYTLTHTNAGGTGPAASTKVIPLAANATLSDKPVYQRPGQTKRFPVDVTNTHTTRVDDHRITVALPAGADPTAANLRVDEYGARGSIDRGSDWRYGGQDINRFGILEGPPVSLDGSTITFKMVGKTRVGETRRFEVSWGDPNLTEPTWNHLGTYAATTTMYPLGRIGPDTEQLPATKAGLPLAGTSSGAARVVWGTGDGNSLVIRPPSYKVSGDATTYGLISGSAPTYTNRNHEILASATLTGSVRSGQSAADWTGTYTARYRHRIRGSFKSDGSGTESILKGLDILTVSAVYICGVSYAPSGTEMTLLEIYGGVNTSNNAIGPWAQLDGGSITAGVSGAALPFSAVSAGLVGTTSGASASAVRVTRCECVDWGTAAPTSIGWRTFGSNGASITAQGLANTRPVPVGAKIYVDFAFVMSQTSRPTADQANTTAPEIAETTNTLGVIL